MSAHGWNPWGVGCFSQASVALNVWQPEVVRGRQKQTVEQCVVPVESRIHALEMEVKLCNQQLQVFDKAYVSTDFSLCPNMSNNNPGGELWMIFVMFLVF